MSKRKNRKNTPAQPTAPIPPPVEEQYEEEPESIEPEPPEEPKARVRVKATGVIAPRAPRSVRASRQAEASGRASTANRKSDTLDPAYVRERLANPTLVVTQADLRQQYSYVAKDLRSMGLLAVTLVVALIVLAQILPK
jgi:hypothetical protein